MVCAGVDGFPGVPSEDGVDVHCLYGLVEVGEYAVDGRALVLSGRALVRSVESSGVRDYHAINVDTVSKYALVLVGGVGIFHLSSASASVRLCSPDFSRLSDYHDTGLESLYRSVRVHAVDISCHRAVRVDVVGVRCRDGICLYNSLNSSCILLRFGKRIWILGRCKRAAQKNGCKYGKCLFHNQNLK